MKTLANGWRRASLAAIATFAVMGAASAQEASDTFGTLLLDPEFEQTYIDTISRVLEDARINADNGSSGPDLSIENLRQDPDFDDALIRRIEDVIDEKLFEQQTAGADDESRLGAEFRDATPQSSSPRSLDSLRFDAVAPYVGPSVAASLLVDNCPVHIKFKSLPLWVNATGSTVAAAKKAAGVAAENAAANHVKAIKKNPGMYCPADCPKGSLSGPPRPSPAKGKGKGSQSLGDIFWDFADAASLPWFRTYHATADWRVSGTVDCDASPAAQTSAIPSTARVKTPAFLAGE